MKKIIDQLVEKCSENSDDNEMIYNGILNEIPFNDYKIVGNCRLYIVLFVVFLVASTVISTVFIYFHWYSKKLQSFTTNINDNYQRN